MSSAGGILITRGEEKTADEDVTWNVELYADGAGMSSSGSSETGRFCEAELYVS